MASASQENRRPTAGELAEAQRIFNELLKEMEKLRRARAKFRKDLRKAVVDGDQMLEALRSK